jgi:streptogramin lyase
MFKSWFVPLPLLLIAAACSTSTGVSPLSTQPRHAATATSGGSFVAEYPVSNSTFVMATGPDGNVWFTMPFANAIGVITPSGNATYYGPPLSSCAPPISCNTVGITAGPDGNMWFTMRVFDHSGGSQVALTGYLGQVSPSGTFTMYQLPNNGEFPNGITVGPDGNIWYVNQHGAAIGRFTIASHTFTEFPIPFANSDPRLISTINGNLWFSDIGANVIGEMTTSGRFGYKSIPTANSVALSKPVLIGGNIWFAEDGASKLGYFNPSPPTPNGSIPGPVTEIDLPDQPGGDLFGDANGRAWFTLQNFGDVASVNTNGSGLQLYPTPTAGSTPNWIIAGPDGNYWFTEPGVNQIGVFHSGS